MKRFEKKNAMKCFKFDHCAIFFTLFLKRFDSIKGFRENCQSEMSII